MFDTLYTVVGSENSGESDDIKNIIQLQWKQLMDFVKDKDFLSEAKGYRVESIDGKVPFPCDVYYT